MTFRIAPRQVLRILLLVIAALLLLHGAGFIAEDFFGNPRFLDLRALFDVSREQNVPTLFSTLQLECAALLLFAAYRLAVRERRAGARYWLGLVTVFAFLGADEFCEWHERLVEPMRRMFHPTGALSYAWVIPYSAFVLLFVASYLRFWWRLPPATRWQFALAGVVFVGGGIGMEMVGSKISWDYGWKNALWDSETFVEEGMEMIGVALFIHAMLGYLRDQAGELRIDLTDDRSDDQGLMRDAALEPLADKRQAESSRNEAA